MVGFLASLLHLSKSKIRERLRWVSEQNELKERTRAEARTLEQLMQDIEQRGFLKVKVLWMVNIE
jgi:hypothetical protein